MTTAREPRARPRRAAVEPRALPGACDHVLLLADADAPHLRELEEHLRGVPGWRRDEAPRARHPRFRVVSAADGDEALRRATAQITVAALDLRLPRRSGLELIQELRSRKQDVAVLAFTTGAPAAEAVAAMLAGADFFHECREGDVAGFERALELAIDHRRLTRLIERNETEVEAARERLAQLSGDLARALPGLRPPHARDDVIPFAEAASRYLHAASRLYAGDAQALAARLGVSYFALRRLLARYGVAFPRSRGHGTPGR